MKKRTIAFTLIELIIVVGIIGILATILIGNMQLAIVRAKISRARADLRTIGTAVEMYYVDNKRYPSMIEPGFAGGPGIIQGSELKWWYVPNALSTPVPYLASADMHCPFGGNWDKADYFPDEIWKRYGYENIDEMIAKAEKFPVFRTRYFTGAENISGPWRLGCVGPDRKWNPSVAYDPTNGINSEGDIIFTQKSPEGNLTVDNPYPNL